MPRAERQRHDPRFVNGLHDRGPDVLSSTMTNEIRALRARMKDFIDGVVFPAEPELERAAEHDVHPETGLPLELYAAAKARGDDPKDGVRGPGTGLAAR